MADDPPNEGNAGKSVWSRPRTRWLLGIPLGGFVMFVAGVAAFGGFNAFMDYSNSLDFCTSCHEMRDYVYAEYKETVHFRNSSGVRAVCSNCHVPKPYFAKLAIKLRASFNEIPAKILGTIDTREKFEAKRLELAEQVWARMKSNDSRECRSCHALESMDLSAQDKSARKKHTLEHQNEKGDTCIDCHKGIAHHLPQDHEEAEAVGGLSSDPQRNPAG